MYGKLTKDQLKDKAQRLCAVDISKDKPDRYSCTHDCCTCGYAKEVKEANND